LVADELTADELAAINGANTPDATNVFLTQDDEVYTKDSNDNVFYKGVTATLGTGCEQNIFHQVANLNTLGDGSIGNIFYQYSQNNVLGETGLWNVFEQDASGFFFGDNLLNVTIKSGSLGADYTNLTDYGFMYGNAYRSEIFRNAEETANYHRYYDPTNDRIVLTLLESPFTVSYIGAGGGGGDVYLANDQTFTGENTFSIGSGNDTPVTITKAGSNAALKVTKSSGSGDAIEVAEGSLSIADETASTIASFDADKRVKSLDTSTYPSLTELAYVKDVTSAIQTQLDAKRKTLQSTGLGTAVTGTTSNTFCKALLIPANTFVAGDLPSVNTRITVTGANGTRTARMYLNTAASLAGSPVLVGTSLSAASSAPTTGIQRVLAIEATTGANTYVPNSSNNVSIETLNFTSAESTLTIDWTVDQYLVVSIQLGNGSDSGNCRYIMIN
jgi:hypothetical protein